MSLYRDEGIVLRTHKLGEADRVVVLLTRHHGKVRAVAKGVRRTRSRFGARLEPGSVVALQLFRGRGELDIVTQAESLERFARFRADLERFARVALVLEIVEHLVPDREPNRALYAMAAGALRELDRTGSALVVAAFVMRVLALEGVQPVVDRCAGCGSTGPLVAFDRGAGGALCAGCRKGQAVSGDALRCLALVAGGRVREALATTPSEATGELEVLATRLAEAHLERRLRAATVLGGEGGRLS
jgi:DNA repair protein RecO (recombination protein O)